MGLQIYVRKLKDLFYTTRFDTLRQLKMTVFHDAVKTQYQVSLNSGSRLAVCLWHPK